jgi:hypothetical protein
MTPAFEDTRLEAIRTKVAAGERLSYQDGLTIYRWRTRFANACMATRLTST